MTFLESVPVAYTGDMQHMTIGVLRGGPSSEYSVSLQSGRAVAQALEGAGYTPLDILIDREGQWHMHGRPRSPARILTHCDAVWNALHGTYGEDGCVQRLLQQTGIPHSGATALAAACAMQKHVAKRILAAHGLPVVPHVLVRQDTPLEKAMADIASMHAGPYVLKPAAAGSSIGVTEVHGGRFALRQQLRRMREHYPSILVEPLVRGIEATCGVIEGFRGEQVYSLLPVEITPPAGHSHFDYEAKYGGESIERCPGNFSPDVSATLQRYAREAHQALGLRHYSRTDFMLTDAGIVILEVNALPGLADGSLMPLSLEAVGGSLSEFVGHVLSAPQR